MINEKKIAKHLKTFVLWWGQLANYTCIMIAIRGVLSEMNRPNSVFSLEYWKVDGTYGEKKRVALRRSGNDLSDRKKMNNSGMLLLVDLSTGGRFDLYIDFLMVFNGVEINHEL